jgi:hypothetical protein
MYKHVGKHGDKKVVVLFRQVPNEDHMALLVYSDLLPRIYHDSVMTVLESPVGQQAENFADALFRNFMSDGINCLEALHKSHLIKKVQTNQIIMTPTPGTSIRLDELNKLLTEMAQGQEAVNRMAEIDSQRGMSGKKSRAEPKELGVSPLSRSQPAAIPESTGGVLTDADLARSRLQQAETMKASAAQLLAEADRLSKEALDLDPTVTPNAKATKTKKAPAKKT